VSGLSEIDGLENHQPTGKEYRIESGTLLWRNFNFAFERVTNLLEYSLLQRGRYIEGFSASRKSVSQRHIGTSTQASKRAAYSLSWLKIIVHSVVDTLFRFCECQIIQRLGARSIAFSLVSQHIAGIQTPVGSYHVTRHFLFLQ
jgi:hypothetical protein